MKNRNIFYLLSSLMVFQLFGCEKLLENDLPKNELPITESYETEAELQMFLVGAYDVTANFLNGRSQVITELLSDNLSGEFNDANGFFREIYNRNTNFFNSEVGDYFSLPYRTIYRANFILENIDRPKDISEAGRDRMLGEARFLRALAHFDLVRLFAQPYGFTANNTHSGIVWKGSTAIEPQHRNTVAEVYDNIVQDLREAESLLPEENGFYADKAAARALLAQVYFQMNDFTNAAIYAGKVISESRFQLSDDINSRFSMAHSPEAVFTIKSTVDPSRNINDIRFGYFRDRFRSDNNAPHLRISREFYNLATSNQDDKRVAWYTLINEGQPNEIIATTRYNSDEQNVVYLHLADMLLIRAESNAMLGVNLNQAVQDVNAVKNRAGLPGLPTSVSVNQLLDEIRKERRLEMVTEGNRTHQLKRLGVLDNNLGIRNAKWDCPGLILQFPISEAIPGFVMNQEGGCN